MLTNVSGTTWTQEMIWCIMNGYDYKAAKSSPLDQRVPYFELSGIWDMVDLPNSFEMVSNLASPRLIKTHLSWSMLPNTLMKEGKGKVGRFH